MLRNIKRKRYELCIESKMLQDLSFEPANKRSFETRREQDIKYKKYKFYDNFIKAVEKQQK